MHNRFGGTLALIALSLIALAGCGGSARHASPTTTSAPASSTSSATTTPTSATTPATSTSSSSTTATSATTSTSVQTASTAVTYAAPVDPQGRPGAGVTVSQGGSGSCEPGSDVIGNANVYRCFGGNVVYDPCWALTDGTSSGRAVLCQEEPWSAAAVRLTLSSPVSLTVTQPPNLEDPWAVELTDGQRCLAQQGAHSYVGGKVVNYYCSAAGSSPGLELLGSPNRAQPRWSFPSMIQQGSSQSAGPTVYVTDAYFAGPPPAATA